MAEILVALLLAFLPACAEEDGSGGPTPCVWDAGSQGNGGGSSYVILGGE